MYSNSTGDERLKDQFKLLEQEIFDLEDYIKDIWEFLPVAVAYINPAGIIMDVDKSLAELLGRPREEIIGTPLEDYSRQKKELGKLREDILSKDFVEAKEFSFVNKEGKAVPVNLSAMVRKDNEENIIGYFASLSGLSAIKKIQVSLEEKVGELKEFNDLAVGRELKMIELEKEINGLLKQLGRPSKY